MEEQKERGRKREGREGEGLEEEEGKGMGSRASFESNLERTLGSASCTLYKHIVEMKGQKINGAIIYHKNAEQIFSC